MSSVDFEQMSNDELRKQMELFGLPKVPITASTRNLLVKRLQTHANGSSTPGKAAAASKARRETVHVVKYSSDDDSDRDAAKEKLKKKMENHKNARRQTMGIPSASPAPAPASRASMIPTPAEKPSRKSMRATPTKTTRESDIVSTSRHIVKTTTIPVTIEDSDEDIIEVPVKRSVDRRSRSTTPTLAKSDLITTSYKQVVGTVHEEEPEDEQSDLEEDVPLSRYSTTRGHYEVNAPEISPVKPMSVRISPLRRTALPGGSFRYEPAPLREGSSSSYTRPSLATTTSRTSYSTKYSGATQQHDDNNPDDFPYLREFSKRLSTLKAEPLHKRQSALTNSGTTRTTTTYTTSGRASNYRPLSHRESHWYDPIMEMLVRLEEKYALKRKILILLAILVVIFVVVMFFY